MTLAIPQEMLKEVLIEHRSWLGRRRASRQMIQSLNGKLLHLANTIPHARKFTSRIQDTLRFMSAINKDWTSVNKNFRADVNWFIRYAEEGNGVSLF